MKMIILVHIRYNVLLHTKKAIPSEEHATRGLTLQILRYILHVYAQLFVAYAKGSFLHHLARSIGPENILSCPS